MKVERVEKSFGGVMALRGVSFEVRRGQIKALIGPNGAGKTTLFHIVTGVEKPNSGVVYFKGERIDGRRPDEVVGMGIARTFQNVRPFAGMTALENVMVGRHRLTCSGTIRALLRTPFLRREEGRVRDEAMWFLEFVGLAAHADQDASDLPFGRQRLLELARALATEPELLLLDEPAAGLNTRETSELAELIRKVRGRGVTVLLVEHDMELVMDISDEVVVLDRGEKISEGPPVRVQRDERVLQAYLGGE